MNKLLLTGSIILAGLIIFSFSCKKTADKSFTATIEKNSITFDSLFGWIDTHNATTGQFSIVVGAKNTKNQNSIYISGIGSSSNEINGTYSYSLPIPSPVPASFQWLNDFNMVLNTEPNRGTYYLNLAGVNSSLFSVTSHTVTEVIGNFSIKLNPPLPAGGPDLSKTILLTGNFNVPYYTKP